ncbi:hypothetical protein C6P46_001447 [Rhodotorula mucilaginosa]|uniref:Uncharacterized protein n=1 Tax=Rhodotorula mucilaginosa TaxID=5537 RepID=A0A9P7B7L3_RHOMI|nr:hypothetical protein C6P46_001447 [Rhodotorula mucilaginosa]TKA57123.1 hypothetical protein B0A53_01079 [Rhodotorula sp. CCFEE 5036]
MSAPNASLRTAWHAVASAWPRDPLRPKLQFADAIRTAADRAFAASESPLTETQRWKANEAARAMQRLVQNRALEQYPVTQRTTRPASFPKHYQRIADTIERAERGEVFKQPGWFKRKFRFS